MAAAAVQQNAAEVAVVAVNSQPALVEQAVEAARDAQASQSPATAEAIGLAAPPPILEAPKLEDLVAEVQVDAPGVLNGGQQMYGNAISPQVVAEDGTLSPAAPPPGSGLPIPPEAITTEATFVGQPGGMTFNTPDIAVPIVEKPVKLPRGINKFPGASATVGAVNHVYVVYANIGSDLSPVTRKKAKKIVIATIIGKSLHFDLM